MPESLKGSFLRSLAPAQAPPSFQKRAVLPVAPEFVDFHRWTKEGSFMATWKYLGKEVTEDEIEKVLKSLICFKCGKELHTDDCPFAKLPKLRVELNALKEKQ
jgi:hypothetical protein